MRRNPGVAYGMAKEFTLKGIPFRVRKDGSWRYSWVKLRKAFPDLCSVQMATLKGKTRASVQVAVPIPMRDEWLLVGSCSSTHPKKALQGALTDARSEIDKVVARIVTETKKLHKVKRALRG